MSRNGVTTNLGQPAGGDWSSANAINSAGAVAGTAMDANGAFRGFVTLPDGTTTLLGGLGGANSYGNAVSANGVVAGSAQTGSGALQASYWNGGTAKGLGTLGGLNSYGYGINASGQIAGYSDLAGDGGTSAFLYENGMMYDLNGLLAPGSSWQLLAAYGINDSGQVVGRGIYNGLEQGFLLTPTQYTQVVQSAVAPALAPLPDSGVPEPSTLFLIGPALLLYFALRSR